MKQSKLSIVRTPIATSIVWLEPTKHLNTQLLHTAIDNHFFQNVMFDIIILSLTYLCFVSPSLLKTARFLNTLMLSAR